MCLGLCFLFFGHFGLGSKQINWKSAVPKPRKMDYTETEAAEHGICLILRSSGLIPLRKFRNEICNYAMKRKSKFRNIKTRNISNYEKLCFNLCFIKIKQEL